MSSNRPPAGPPDQHRARQHSADLTYAISGGDPRRSTPPRPRSGPSPGSSGFATSSPTSITTSPPRHPLEPRPGSMYGFSFRGSESLLFTRSSRTTLPLNHPSPPTVPSPSSRPTTQPHHPPPYLTKLYNQGRRPIAAPSPSAGAGPPVTRVGPRWAFSGQKPPQPVHHVTVSPSPHPPRHATATPRNSSKRRRRNPPRHRPRRPSRARPTFKTPSPT